MARGTNRIVSSTLLYYIFCEYQFYHISLYVSGMVAALTNESATSKSVYFAHCTSEMIFITHLLTEQPEKLAGPLLADTYVTLLKGRNAWYGQMLAKGELSPDMGDSIKGKGMIQVME
jgi:glycerol-3-phosphate dehydrogenase (NAD+)